MTFCKDFFENLKGLCSVIGIMLMLVGTVVAIVAGFALNPLWFLAVPWGIVGGTLLGTWMDQ